MYKRREIGTKGEKIACKYLEQNNYKILETNFYCRQGEIDIIAADLISKELVFIEVKTRTNLLYGRPAEAVNMAKQNHFNKCIKYYVYKCGLEKYYIRIDVIEVFATKTGFKINHIKQAF